MRSRYPRKRAAMTEEEKQKEIQRLTEEIKKHINSDPRVLPVALLMISPFLYVLAYFIAKALS